MPQERSITLIDAQKKVNSAQLAKFIEDMHRDVKETRTRIRERAIKAHNDKTHVHTAQFDIGDFVLVAKESSTKGSKLLLKWVGPRRVTRAVSEHTYEVQNILNESLSLVHANRLKFYANLQLNITESLKYTVDHNEPVYNIVVKLLDLRFNYAAKQWEVQVSPSTSRPGSLSS